MTAPSARPNPAAPLFRVLGGNRRALARRFPPETRFLPSEETP